MKYRRLDKALSLKALSSRLYFIKSCRHDSKFVSTRGALWRFGLHRKSIIVHHENHTISQGGHLQSLITTIILITERKYSRVFRAASSSSSRYYTAHIRRRRVLRDSCGACGGSNEPRECVRSARGDRPGLKWCIQAVHAVSRSTALRTSSASAPRRGGRRVSSTSRGGLRRPRARTRRVQQGGRSLCVSWTYTVLPLWIVGRCLTASHRHGI